MVNVTLENAEQLPLVTVHFNTVEVPAATPVTNALLAVDGAMETPVQPLVQVQAPVPVDGLVPVFGLFAASVNDPLLHCC